MQFYILIDNRNCFAPYNPFSCPFQSYFTDVRLLSLSQYTTCRPCWIEARSEGTLGDRTAIPAKQHRILRKRNALIESEGFYQTASCANDRPSPEIGAQPGASKRLKRERDRRRPRSLRSCPCRKL